MKFAMKNILCLNNFVMLQPLSKNINYPSHLESSKDNIEKIGVYKIANSLEFFKVAYNLNKSFYSNFSDCFNLESTELDAYFEEISSLKLVAYVDNYSVINVNKFNKERIYIPFNSIVSVELSQDD